MKLRTAGAAATPAVLVLLALAIRIPYIARVGPSEGGGDEWYSVWRSFAVLAEQGNPGNFLHPALYYDMGALLFDAIRFFGGSAHDLVDLFAQFVRDEIRFLRDLEYLSAVFGAMTVGVVYSLARRLFGTSAGIVSAGLLMFLSLHVEYSQRARVDALFVLCVAACGLALARLHESGSARDSALAGAAAGLATAANYPGVLLLVPLIWVHVRRRGAVGIPMALAAIGVAITFFAATNVALFSDSRAVWEGVRFQAGMAFHTHAYREGILPGFYLHTLLAQGTLFCVVSVLAVGSAILRGGMASLLAISSAAWIALFALLSTQFDRYVLPPLPWICVLIGGLFAGSMRSLARFGAAGRAIPVVLAISLVGQSAWASRDRLAPQGIWESQPGVEQRNWLLEHVPPGSTVWLEADLQPLLQATFADPGGTLQSDFRDAFKRVHPAFVANFIKGERVETSASIEASLMRERKFQFALTCDRFDEYAHRDAHHADFYDALKADCHKVFSTQDGCWIAQCP